MKLPHLLPALVIFIVSLCGEVRAQVLHRHLYVAAPGVRNYLEYGGHGVLVFDMGAEHRFLRRIPMKGLDTTGKPLNVKGICASATTGRLYVSSIRSLQCLDLLTDKFLWERDYEGGCDRMSISPDGKVIYLPSLEKDHWHVIDALSGDIITRLEPKSKAHNTVFSLDGAECYLAGLGSPILRVADARTHRIVRDIGPFSAPVRPFTVNGASTLAFCCVNDLLGFEIGDLRGGKMLHRVEVKGFKKGPVLRHGCPSHGIGITPDEKQAWLCDAHNKRLHIFDITKLPPKPSGSILLKDEPGWVTFSIDGKTAYPSTGEIIDTAKKKIIGELKDEKGAAVQSEKMLEIQFLGPKLHATGDQFGVGRKK